MRTESDPISIRELQLVRHEGMKCTYDSMVSFLFDLSSLN